MVEENANVAVERKQIKKEKVIANLKNLNVRKSRRKSRKSKKVNKSRRRVIRRKEKQTTRWLFNNLHDIR